MTYAENKTITQSQFDEEQKNFTGTDGYYRHGLLPKGVGPIYTDGVQYIADTQGAYWLLDLIILTYAYDEQGIFKANNAENDMLVWQLNRTFGTDEFTLTAMGGSGLIFTKVVPYSDCPVDKVIMWQANGVLYLPSEH